MPTLLRNLADTPAITRDSARDPAPDLEAAAAPLSRSTRDAYHGWSMSSVGLEMGLSVIIGMLFGWWLDGKLGTDPWMMFVFLGFGLAAGFKGVFRAMRQADRIAAKNEAREAAAKAAAEQTAYLEARNGGGAA